jgi:hypothetical protein
MAQQPNESNPNALEQESSDLGTTPSGRAYTNRRWTFGNSAELVEGESPEPFLVTAAWIAVPVGLGILLISLMVASAGS